MDYEQDKPIKQEFFAKVQNKVRGAVYAHTAGELTVKRADLTKEEFADLGRIVNALPSDIRISTHSLPHHEKTERSPFYRESHGRSKISSDP